MICTQSIIYHDYISKYPYDSYDVASRFIHNKHIYIHMTFLCMERAPTN